MTNRVEADHLSGVLSHLLKNEEGNVIAIMAAAILPVIGLVGGGVDMSRLYLAQTRLQAACDSGSLMGRKVMAGGTWADNSNRANTLAIQAFNANFKPGGFGTGAVTKTFTESGGKVTGNASVVVPMTLMKVFGQRSRTITVQCSSEMRIPNSDVMFVLDTTGSMDDPVDDDEAVSATNPIKITELRIAVKCFYETLTQKNISDVTYTQCGESADPVASSSNTAQIRFGFVPYSISVNVGRLLPLNYIADSWFYQTRRANWTVDPDNSYVLGSVGPLTQVGSPVEDPASGNWETVENDVVIDGSTFSEVVETTKGGLNCANKAVDSSGITWPATQSVGPGINGPYPTGSTPTPVYPATSVSEGYEKTSTSGSTQYRYVADKSNIKNNKKCFLQQKVSSTVTTTQYTASRPVTWIPKNVFNNWTYNRHSINVSGLKNVTNNSWNSSITLPVGANGTDTPVGWDGCILERPTQKNVTTWDTSSTSTQKDMSIDLIPSAADPTTQWGPRLVSLLYARESGGNRTLSAVTSTGNMSAPTSGNTTTACPTQSKLLQVWSPTNYRNYINSLSTDGFTFHDIGMLWGARLASPTGIFAAHNAVANDNVQRHMIFMTDGDTNANSEALSAYGVPWYDRLQTDSGAAPTTSQLNTLTNQRTEALCTAIKNKNIQLWVVSYGSSVSSATNTRLQQCASDGKFFQYTPGVSLTSQFKQIAGQIAALRLTS